MMKQQARALIPSTLFAFVLAFLMGCGLTDTRSDSSSEYVEDAVITTRINAAIFNDAELRDTDVTVETVNGEARLSGTVDSQEEADALVDLTESIEGVTSVQNDIQVSPGN